MIRDRVLPRYWTGAGAPTKAQTIAFRGQECPGIRDQSADHVPTPFSKRGPTKFCTCIASTERNILCRTQDTNNGPDVPNHGIPNTRAHSDGDHAINAATSCLLLTIQQWSLIGARKPLCVDARNQNVIGKACYVASITIYRDRSYRFLRAPGRTYTENTGLTPCVFAI